MRLCTALGLLCLLALACGGDGSTTTSTDPGPTETVAAAGAYPASPEGVCMQWQACNCLDDPMDTCLRVMGGEGMNGVIHGCIVQAGCGSCQDAVSRGCIDSYYAAASAASRAEHETTMDIIGNYPTGGNCAAGQTAVYDAGGAFVRCQ